MSKKTKDENSFKNSFEILKLSFEAAPFLSVSQIGSSIIGVVIPVINAYLLSLIIGEIFNLL